MTDLAAPATSPSSVADAEVAPRAAALRTIPAAAMEMRYLEERSIGFNTYPIFRHIYQDIR
jgi:hypothetical protein